MADGATPRARAANRRAIGITGECVIIFEENAARILRDALIDWLG